MLPNKTVVLRGQVTAPPDTNSRAEAVVEDIAGFRRVVNEIEVLPVSPNDERLRRALYREIYGFDSPLFRYDVGSRQAIHMIVDRGFHCRGRELGYSLHGRRFSELVARKESRRSAGLDHRG